MAILYTRLSYYRDAVDVNENNNNIIICPYNELTIIIVKSVTMFEFEFVDT